MYKASVQRLWLGLMTLSSSGAEAGTSWDGTGDLIAQQERKHLYFAFTVSKAFSGSLRKPFSARPELL